MAIGSKPDVIVTPHEWTDLGVNKLVQWKGGADALVYISASAPANTDTSGLVLSEDTCFMLSTEFANVYVRGMLGNATLAVAEVTP